MSVISVLHVFTFQASDIWSWNTKLNCVLICHLIIHCHGQRVNEHRELQKNNGMLFLNKMIADNL
jgi:hypothetical protein